MLKLAASWQQNAHFKKLSNVLSWTTVFHVLLQRGGLCISVWFHAFQFLSSDINSPRVTDRTVSAILFSATHVPTTWEHHHEWDSGPSPVRSWSHFVNTFLRLPRINDLSKITLKSEYILFLVQPPTFSHVLHVHCSIQLTTECVGKTTPLVTHPRAHKYKKIFSLSCSQGKLNNFNLFACKTLRKIL